MLENFLILINKEYGDIDVRKINYIIEKSKRSICKIISISENEIDETLEDIIVELAVYRYSILGLEATKSESYNGTAFSYMLDIPDHIKTQLQPFIDKNKRKLRVM